MSDRKKAIETLKQLRLDYEEFYEEHNNEVTHAYDMAIASLETDEAYQLEYEQTTKNDLGVDCKINVLDDFIEYAKKTFGIELTFKKSDNPDTYEKLFGTTKNDLGVDAVSRADVLKLMQDNWHTHNGDWAMQESMDDIRALPSVTPIRPKGHWISHREHCEMNNLRPSGLGSYFWCSECDCGVDSKVFHRVNYNYCPNCGADMREVEE